MALLEAELEMDQVMGTARGMGGGMDLAQALDLGEAWEKRAESFEAPSHQPQTCGPAPLAQSARE